MSASLHCTRRRIVSRAFNTSLFVASVMRIELAALSYSMSLLSICDRRLRTRTNLCSHTKKICKIKFRNEECCLKLMLKKSCSMFYSTIRAPTALVICVCLSRTPKLCRRRFLSLDFAMNTLVNRINSFYFYAIKRIMQYADI